MIRAMDVAARKAYQAMPGPKIVVATGACALGGVYQTDAFVHGTVAEILPVDVWIPGCPPSPLALLHGLLVAVGRLAEKVRGLRFTQDPGAEAGLDGRGRPGGGSPRSCCSQLRRLGPGCGQPACCPGSAGRRR